MFPISYDSANLLTSLWEYYFKSLIPHILQKVIYVVLQFQNSFIFLTL